MGDVVEVVRKKPGPKPKNGIGSRSGEYRLNGDQKKFIIDVSGDEEVRQMILNLLSKCNSKAFGKEVTFRELVIYSFAKITEKDIPKLQECSLTEREKAERIVADYNQKHGTNLSLEQFVLLKDGK